MSPMISSLHTGGDRKNLGWELGGLGFLCGSGMGSGDLEQIAFSLLWTSWLPQRGLPMDLGGGVAWVTSGTLTVLSSHVVDKETEVWRRWACARSFASSGLKNNHHNQSNIRKGLIKFW